MVNHHPTIPFLQHRGLRLMLLRDKWKVLSRRFSQLLGPICPKRWKKASGSKSVNYSQQLSRVSKEAIVKRRFYTAIHELNEIGLTLELGLRWNFGRRTIA